MFKHNSTTLLQNHRQLILSIALFLFAMNQAEEHDGEMRPGSGFTEQLSVQGKMYLSSELSR